MLEFSSWYIWLIPDKQFDVLADNIIQVVRLLLLIAMFYFTIAFIYKYAPAVHKRWKLSSPGTILATFLILVTAWLFSFWVTNFGSFNKVYGSIGTILIIMLLVYMNSMILLIGFELNVSIHSLKHQAEEREKHAVTENP